MNTIPSDSNTEVSIQRILEDASHCVSTLPAPVALLEDDLLAGPRPRSSACLVCSSTWRNHSLTLVTQCYF